MQTIALNGVGTKVEIGAATSSSVPYPATVPAGAVAILVLTVNSSTLITSLGAPWVDWERRSRAANTVIPSMYLTAKYPTDGTEGGTSISVTHPNAASIAHIEVWTGVDTTTPLDVAIGENDNTATNQATAPTITPVTAGVALVHYSGNNSNAATSTPPSAPGAFTEILDGTGTRSGAVSYLLNQPASATGAVTAVWGTAGAGMAFLVALRPGPDPASVPASSPRRRFTLVPSRLRVARLGRTVPDAPVTPAATTRRARLRLPVQVRRRQAQLPPAAVTVTPTQPLTQPRRRPTPQLRRFGRRNPQAVVPPTVVTPATTPLPQPRRRTPAPLQSDRRRPLIPPIDVPAPVPSVRRRRAIPPMFRRRTPQSVITPAAAAPVTTPLPQPRRRLPSPIRGLRRPAPVWPPPTTATATTTPAVQPRRRLVPALFQRRRTPTALPPAVVVPLPQSRRRQVTPPRARRGRPAPLTPPTVTPAAPVFPRPRRRAWWPLRRRRPAALPPVTPSAVLPSGFAYKAGPTTTSWQTGDPTDQPPTGPAWDSTQQRTPWSTGRPTGRAPD